MGLNYINDYELVNGYAVIDNDFSIITANERMYKFVGISTKFTIAEIIHQVDIEDFINVANSLRLGQSKSMVLRMKRIDNSYRWVLADIKRCILNTRYDEHAAEYLELCVSDVIALRNRCNTLMMIFYRTEELYQRMTNYSIYMNMRKIYLQCTTILTMMP